MFLQVSSFSLFFRKPCIFVSSFCLYLSNNIITFAWNIVNNHFFSERLRYFDAGTLSRSEILSASALFSGSVTIYPVQSFVDATRFSNIAFSSISCCFFFIKLTPFVFVLVFPFRAVIYSRNVCNKFACFCIRLTIFNKKVDKNTYDIIINSREKM